MHADPATERLANRESFEYSIRCGEPLGFGAGRVIVTVMRPRRQEAYMKIDK